MAEGSPREGEGLNEESVEPERASWPGFSLAPWSEVAVRTETEMERDAARTGSVAPPPQVPPPPPAQFEGGMFTFSSELRNNQSDAPHTEAEEPSVSRESLTSSFAPSGKETDTTAGPTSGTNAELRSFSFATAPVVKEEQDRDLVAQCSRLSFAPAGQEDVVTAGDVAKGELPCFSFTASAVTQKRETTLSTVIASLKSPLTGAMNTSKSAELAAARQEEPKWEPTTMSNAEKLTAALAANDVATVRELAQCMSSTELEEPSPWSRETAITAAAKEEQWDIVDILLEVMSAPALLLLLCVEGRSALSWAAKHGKVEVLRRLLDKASGEEGVLDDNWRWKEGTESPVHAAILEGHQDCLEALVEKCNVHQLTSCDIRGRTPLMLSVEVDKGEYPLAGVLIAALPPERLLDKTLHSTPTLAQRTSSSESSLDIMHLGSALDDAIKLGKFLLMGLLTRAAPIQQVVTVTSEGMSYLMTSVKAGNYEAVKFFAFFVPGAVEAAHRQPPTPLAVAAANGNEMICELLASFVAEFVHLPPYSRTIGRECLPLLAARNKHDQLAILLLSALPFHVWGEGELLTEAFDRTDSALLEAVLSDLTQLRNLRMVAEKMPPARASSLRKMDLNFHSFLASAPLRNFELLLRAFPKDVLAWLSFSDVIDPMELTKFTTILDLVSDLSPSFFELVLKDLLLYAMRTNQKDHFIAGLQYCFDALAKVSMLKNHNVVTTFISIGQAEHLLLCLEHLPQYVWYPVGARPCTPFYQAVVTHTAACLRVLFETLPRHMWIDHSPDQAMSPLMQCFRGMTPRMEVLEVLLEYLSEEELMLSESRSGWAAIHLAATGRTCCFVPLAEKLSQESLMSQTKSGLTPLHIAAKESSDVTVEWLVQHLPHSAKCLRDSQGRTPADVADNEDIAAMLMAQPKAALSKR